MANKNFDSDFCGSLPLHNVNLIQPHGYLLVLEKNTLQVIQASENLQDILGVAVQQIVNKPFEQYAPEGQVDELRSKINTGIKDKIPVTVTLNNKQLLVLVHAKEEYLLLELEEAGANAERTFINVFQEVKYVMATIEMATSVQQACEIAIHELRRISGFDGIMMYRFDKDWNGTVIAEEKSNGLENYLGLTFPASDVPRQARQLYLKNPYRLIPNRVYTPVRLYPVLNPITRSFTDLSDCNLRSVAGVHLEYLANMNVMASMSVRVIHNESLWGLISCHHTQPNYLNFEICSVFELLSSVISNKISSILNKENYDFVSSLQEKRNALIEYIYAENDIARGLFDKDINIMSLFNATGVVIFTDGNIVTTGQTPDPEMLENLLLWLQAKNINKIFATNSLSKVFDEAISYANIASGMLVIPINSVMGDYIVCFRPEAIQNVEWGGDPNKAINFEADGRSYHPRNSFKSWMETVTHTAKPWHEQELSVAETFRSFIFEFKTKQ